MPNPLKFDVNADARQARAEMQRLGREVAKLKEQNAQLAKESKKSAKEQQSGATAVAGKLASVAAGYITVQGAVNLATRAMRDYEEQARKANEAQSVGGGEAIALSRNLPLAVDRVAFDRQLSDISVRQGVPIGELETAAGAAFSARRNLLPAAIGTAVEAGAILNPEGGEALAGTARGIVSVMEVSPGATAEQVAGFVQEVSSSSNVSDPTLFGTNVTPTIGALTRFGNTTEQAGELASLFTNIGDDTTGKRSGTALKTVAKKFQEMGIAGGSTFAQFETLFANPQLAQDVFSKLNPEANIAGGLGELLLGGEQSRARILFENIKKQVPDVGEASQATFDETVNKLTATPRAQAFVNERRQAQVKESLDASRVADAREVEVKRIVQDTLSGLGVGFIDRTVASANTFAAGFGDGPEDTIATAVQAKSTLKQVGGLGGENRALVEQQLARLDAIIAEMQKLNAAQPQGLQPQPAPIVAPNAGGEQ